MRQLLVLISLLWLTVLPCAALSGAVISANYYPAYNTNDSAGGSNYNGNNWDQASVSKPAYQGQAPWYCTVGAGEFLTCEMTQAIMDKDLQIAQAAGITNFAFYWTGNQPGGVQFQNNPVFQEAWDWYQSSTENTRVNWCLNARIPFIGANPFSDTAQWQANVDYFVTLMGQSTYQKLTGNRPLIYFFYVSSDLTSWFGGSQANLKTATDYLRSQALLAGLGDPYIVFQGLPAAQLATVGGDAISQYFNASAGLTRASVATTATYAAYDATVQAYWTSLSATTKIVPVLQPGQDKRARIYTPPGHQAGLTFPRMGMSLYWEAGTPAAIAAGQFTAIATWMDANPTKHDGVIWLYSWTEHAEGGTAAMQPTRGDPVAADPPYTLGTSTQLSLLLNAIGPLLYGYR